MANKCFKTCYSRWKIKAWWHHKLIQHAIGLILLQKKMEIKLKFCSNIKIVQETLSSEVFKIENYYNSQWWM